MVADNNGLYFYGRDASRLQDIYYRCEKVEFAGYPIQVVETLKL